VNHIPPGYDTPPRESALHRRPVRTIASGVALALLVWTMLLLGAASIVAGLFGYWAESRGAAGYPYTRNLPH
jgi:hypothetical protein